MSNYEISKFKKNNIDIVIFWKENKPNGIFSEWHQTEFYSKNNKFINIKQWMAFRKAVIFDDKESRDKILLAKEPATIIFLSRNVKNFDKETWNNIKYNELEEGNYLKFKQNNCERFALYDTGDSIIIYANPYNESLGIGMSDTEVMQLSKSVLKNMLYYSSKCTSSNLLGKSLMAVRHRLRHENYLDNDY